MDKLKQAFNYTKASQQKERSKGKQRGKQRTAAAVFFCTFGTLPEAHFLHAIYHFKAQEVKNPTLQTVYDLELKRGRYGVRKTTAPEVCETRTPFAHHFAHPLAWCEFSPISVDSTRDLFFWIFCINFHSSPCNPPIIRFLN